MIADAIKTIQDLARRAGTTEIVCPEAEPEHVYGVRLPDGTIEWRAAQPKGRRYSLSSVAAVVDATRHFTRRLAIQETDPAVVFVGPRAITVVLDEATTRREHLVMPLTTTHEFATLSACEKSRAYRDQKAFVSMLRIDLAGSVPPAAVAAFRDLRFRHTAEGVMKLDPGKESLGRSVNREVLLAGNPVPEDVEVSVDVYRELVNDDIPNEANIECAVETDVEKASFMLSPKSGELEVAQRNVGDQIRRRLAEMLAGEPVVLICGDYPSP